MNPFITVIPFYSIALGYGGPQVVHAADVASSPLAGIFTHRCRWSAEHDVALVASRAVQRRCRPQLGRNMFFLSGDRHSPPTLESDTTKHLLRPNFFSVLRARLRMMDLH